MKPKISVIVPIYGIDKYLGLCVESILNQTYTNLEVILVDDGAVDRCPEICDLYAKKDDRIRVIHKTNGGLVSARKAGVLASTGEYVGYVDGDDWIGPGFYQSLYSAMEENAADVAIAGFSRDLFSKCQTILNHMPMGVYEGEKLQELYGSMISNGSFYRHGITTYVWNKLFKRKYLFSRQLDVDNRITVGEDAAVVYPLLLDCKKICITGNCAYHYRQREDSMLKKTGKFYEEAVRLKILYEHLSDMAGKYPAEYGLQKQVDEFLLGTYMIRSGGAIISEKKELQTFPFSKNIVGKRIVVYGAGTFGQQFMKRLQDQEICEVVAWLDEDYWEYRRCGMDVDSICTICDLSFDYIIIANLDSQYAGDIKRSFLDYGIGEEKILFPETTQEARVLALEEYLR